MWDGDLIFFNLNRTFMDMFQAHRVGWRPRSIFLLLLMAIGSKPTVWDGDSNLDKTLICHPQEFRAHRVGWRLVGVNNFPNRTFGSEPTVWDGDVQSQTLSWQHLLVPSPPCGMATYNEKKQTTYQPTNNQPTLPVPSPPCGIPFPSLNFLKTKRKGFNILKAWKTGG